MGASASKTKTLYNGYGYSFDLVAIFTENSTDVANNTSNITVTAQFKAYSSNWQTGWPSWLTIYWHDNRENYDRQVAVLEFAGINQYETKTASGTINVTHKDDGTLSGYAYAVFEKGSTTTAWACNSGNVATDNTTLTTIARASQPTLDKTTFNIGDTITIYTNRKSNTFTHTVTFYFGTYSYQIATNVTDSVTFNTSTIANNMYQQIPNASVGEGNVTVETYNGATSLGNKNVIFNAKVINSNPTYNASYLDTNSTTVEITQNDQQLIRNNSTLMIQIANASAKNYATLSTLSAVINGTTYNGTLSGTLGTINVGTLNLSSNTTAQVRLTDSRGITTTKNLNLIILDWVLPTAIISLQRQNNFYSETDINVNAEYSSLDSKNTITIKVRSKKTSESTYGAYTTLQDNVTTTLTLDNNYAWNVQVLVQDEIGSTTYNLTIDRGIPIIYFDRILRSMGINCFPADAQSLEIGGENVMNRIEGFGEVCMSAPTSDWNTACGTRSGFYMGADMSNSPPGTTVANWWWVIHLAHNNLYQRQVAFSFLNNGQVFTRIMNNGNWNNWTLLNGTSAKSTDVNGWEVVDTPTYTEYTKKGDISNTYSGTSWGSTTLSSLPDGMQTLGTNNLTASVISSDPALNCNIGTSTNDDEIILQYNNTYAGSVTPTIKYNMRIIEYK